MTTDRQSALQQISGYSRDSTAGLTAPVRLTAEEFHGRPICRAETGTVTRSSTVVDAILLLPDASQNNANAAANLVENGYTFNYNVAHVRFDSPNPIGANLRSVSEQAEARPHRKL